ncbi:MAG: sigma-70 family RNA polymerase sigma factor [Chitinophagales bacterium]
MKTHRQLMTEQVLIAALQDDIQQKQAFQTLVETYQERLYWHIRKLVLNHEDANDVIQNTFIKAWKGLKNFRTDAKLYTWLYRIATNESLTFIQNRKKKHAESFDEGEAYSPAKQLKADQYFDGSEAEIKLFKALETLPEKQRVVFQLRYFEELKYEDIAEITDTSVGALKASYHHAVKKIEHFILEH